jgi:hypothetical protein
MQLSASDPLLLKIAGLPKIDDQGVDPIGTLEASKEATKVFILDVELEMLQQVRERFFADLETDLEECAVIAAVHGVYLALVLCDSNGAVVVEIVIDFVA